MAMATMNQSSPALSMDVPHTQNTAPVLEFRCLYTSDLRRKQKRWQDGRLKFHTFNKRVMAYDDRSNFVGDIHWRKDYEFAEGEELELERGGIMIEVGECIGKRDQDLTELIEKRVKDREERVAAKNASTPMRPQPSLNPQTPAGSDLLRLKSLNAVLGNPTGHYGKAVITKQSPFEQRQQTNRDEIENARPAKRRKQDATPPSKSGYAQALMGTKLTLALSRPPSSASIRYKPFRSRIQRPPAATIDLTGDDEPTRSVMGKEERTVTKPNRKKPHNSPPARSGYASNLTGALLNLNKPEIVAPKRPPTGFGLNRKGLHSADDTGSSSAAEPDSLVEDEPPAKRKQKQKKSAKKRTKKSLPDPPDVSRSLSPPITSRATSFSNSTTKDSKDKVTQEPSLRRLTDQTVSALRIKSRPRKMMMLMDRPISRSPVPVESSDDAQLVPKKAQTKSARQDVVLSQATIGLDAFRAQQEQRLQDRLNGKRPPELEDFLSSPTDSGIDYQMIDNLLSRKIKPSKKLSSEVSTETQQLSSLSDVESDGRSNGTSQNKMSTQQGATSDTDSPANVNAAVPSEPSNRVSRDTGHEWPDTQILDRQLSKVPKTLLKPTIPSSDAESSIVASLSQPRESPQIPKLHSPKAVLRSTIPSTDTTSGLVAPSSENLASQKIAGTEGRKTYDNATTQITPVSLAEKLSESEQGCEARQEELSSMQNPESPPHAKASPNEILGTTNKRTTLQTQSQTAKAVTWPIDSSPINPSNEAMSGHARTPAGPELPTSIAAAEARPKPPLIPPHFTSVIQSATDHFRSIIKSLASPPQQTIPQPPTPEQHVRTALVIEAEKPEPMSSEIAIKASPRPSPMPDGLRNEAQQAETIRSTSITGNTSAPTDPIIPNTRPIQPKPKLINPATRGPSIKMTASKTVNALAPAFNAPAMMPPPASTLARPGRSIAQNEAGNGRVREAVRESAPGGPWSRESFDLFGNWRPPGRERGAGAVNG